MVCHDFGKSIDEVNERDVTRTKGPEVMLECGFAPDFITKVLEYWELMEQEEDGINIRTTPIETQIVSTADGCSHFVGMFYPSFWRRGFAGSYSGAFKKKIEVDWNRKIVLPEAREAFQARYENAKELFGEYPEKFI